MRHLVLPVLLLALPAARAGAQEGPPANAPVTVRVSLRNDDRVTGYLRGRSADELVVYTSDSVYRRVPLADVQRFEVRGRTGSYLKRGALFGVLVWASVMTTGRVGALDRAGWASWQSGAILAAGTGLGTAIGASVPRYGWRDADPRAKGSAGALAGARLTLRF
jgi:hypothetical protein